MDRPFNLRQSPVAGEEYEPTTVPMMDDVGEIDPSKNIVTVELPDGSVNINFGALGGITNPEDASKHDENLAKHLDVSELNSIASDLLRLISDDLQRQEQRLQDVVKGIDLLGIKLEEPRTEPGEEGMSVVRHPLLLEAVLRFQANARGEMLPADGPVKIRNDGADTQQINELANALEKDFNAYLTAGAPEYYPDTDRMFFSLGHGGEAYKKVYFHPIKRRPVSETVDRKDLILSDGAVSIESCARVTHRSMVKQSDVRRMQLAGVWRDVPLFLMGMADQNQVDLKLSDISGVAPKTTFESGQQDREIYECYCELNLKGFEHKEDGEETGLALPYRVTIDKEAQDVLEIRRWWDEDDETCTRKEVFVEYVFVPAFPGVNLGLLHILGNASRALTAAWRIALDNGMLANFPGGLMARSAGKQQTTNIRVSPGGLAPIDTEGGSIKDAIMPLPYRDVTAGFTNIIQMVDQAAQRVGGTAELAVGEGRNDAPVGTTIALIEQAQKVLNAVHKRMHTAQAKEFRLLKELFKRSPGALSRGNAAPMLPQDDARIVEALNNADLVPCADPNTASQSMRIQKAIAIKMLASQSPMLYDMMEVDRRVMEMVGISDIDELFTKVPPQGPQVDPAKAMSAQAQMLGAQAKLADIELKAKTADQDAQMRALESHVKMQDSKTRMMDSLADNQNRSADREAQLAVEQMKLEREKLIHQGRMEDQTHRHQMDRHKVIQDLLARQSEGGGENV